MKIKEKVCVFVMLFIGVTGLMASTQKDFNKFVEAVRECKKSYQSQETACKKGARKAWEYDENSRLDEVGDYRSILDAAQTESSFYIEKLSEMDEDQSKKRGEAFQEGFIQYCKIDGRD